MLLPPLKRTASPVDQPHFPASRLAFGGGSLMGRLTARESAKLVGSALDGGIRHFDTARMYSNGESEVLLGAVLRHHDDVTITTKVGLGRPSTSGWQRARNAVLRRGVRIRDGFATDSETTPRGGRAVGEAPRADFSPELVLRSIDTSRRLLHRESLDCVLLHEVAHDQVTQQLRDLLETILDRGLAQRVGVATRPSELQRMVAQQQLPGTVVQQPGGPLNVAVRVPVDQVRITHSLLGPGGTALHTFLAWLTEEPARGSQLEEAVEAPLDASTVAAALLSAALAEAAQTVIISSRSSGHVTELCRASRGDRDEVVAAVAAAVAEFRAGAVA